MKDVDQLRFSHQLLQFGAKSRVFEVNERLEGRMEWGCGE
jgi:hypothetical protein